MLLTLLSKKDSLVCSWILGDARGAKERGAESYMTISGFWGSVPSVPLCQDCRVEPRRGLFGDPYPRRLCVAQRPGVSSALAG